tara:strand:- start:97 stop:630 length:534 start_codon:yes stop_codon:yes gene_type:complete
MENKNIIDENYAYTYDNLTKINQIWSISILVLNFIMYSFLKIKNSVNLFKLFCLFYFIHLCKEIIVLYKLKKNRYFRDGVNTPHYYNIIFRYFMKRWDEKNEAFPEFIHAWLRLFMLVTLILYLLKTSNKTMNLYLLILNTAFYYYNSWLTIGSKPLLIILINIFLYRHYKEIKYNV